MSMQLITTRFKTNLVKNFIDTVDASANSYYYVCAHKSTAFPNDLNPPAPGTSVRELHYELYDELIFAKHITKSDVNAMIPTNLWVSGNVYTPYDDLTQDLGSKMFYVTSFDSGEYHIFKCLGNNFGSISTAKPRRSQTYPSDVYYRTSDGYEWKYLYTITQAQYAQYATGTHIPVIPNPQVTANSVSGAIDAIVLDTATPNRYTSYATGVFKQSAIDGNTLIYAIESNSDTPLSADNYFYENCSLYIDSGLGDGDIRTIVSYFVSGSNRVVILDSPFSVVPNLTSTFIIAPKVVISGDGHDAKARVVVNTSNNSISEVVILDRGKDYTYANILIVGNSGISTASTSGRAIIAPPGGHGSDVINELYATNLGISITFGGSEANTIPAINDYRKLSILRAPSFKQVKLTLNSGAVASGIALGDELIQRSTGARGFVSSLNGSTITVESVLGMFEKSYYSYDSSNNIVFDSNTSLSSLNSSNTYITAIDRSFETIDQRSIYQISMIDSGTNSSGFLKDEQVVQDGVSNSGANLVKISLEGENSAYSFSDGEYVSQTVGLNTATGVVVARSNSTLTIANMSGFITPGTILVGTTSGASAMVLAYDSSVYATASGIVHTSNIVDGSGTIALTNVNGAFLMSDDSTNTINTFKGQTSQAVAKLSGSSSSNPSFVDGSGEFIYTESFVPISRSEDQTERIKILIEF